jgi:hypothetical protein
MEDAFIAIVEEAREGNGVLEYGSIGVLEYGSIGVLGS